jgi:protein regulator of cytokinesis 1
MAHHFECLEALLSLYYWKLTENCQYMQPEKTSGTIKQQLAAIAPTLEQLNKKKNERVREFVSVQSQIDQICGEIAGTTEVGEQVATPQVNEDDLTLERLEDFRSQLQELEKEKVFTPFLT